MLGDGGGQCLGSGLLGKERVCLCGVVPASMGTGIHIPAPVTGVSASCQGGVFREGDIDIEGAQPGAGGQLALPQVIGTEPQTLCPPGAWLMEGWMGLGLTPDLALSCAGQANVLPFFECCKLLPLS